MARLPFIRISGLLIIGLLGIVSLSLQITGVFLPFDLVMHNWTTTPTISHAGSYWTFTANTIDRLLTTNPATYKDWFWTITLQLVTLLFIIAFPLTILVPAFTTIMGLLNRWRLIFLIPGLMLALLGLLEVGLGVFFTEFLNGFCPGAETDAECYAIVTVPGPGLAPLLWGYSLSILCVIASIIHYKHYKNKPNILKYNM
ncbi:hypothetical protein [Dictyobacter formicarum]|uniref:Uncharacterized protein n=1 Tax=Dictyobacter formicarum TaxID=2778368 RepID=A0ABQ3VJK1_9CHLR|nr:hypothetical protein [Dictyobacter formicarum]GHO85586.1 hypothetical protein KSZ_35920 [Dictyobacter formicarum]